MKTFLLMIFITATVNGNEEEVITSVDGFTSLEKCEIASKDISFVIFSNRKLNLSSKVKFSCVEIIK